jgi:multidrug efflux pump
VVKTLLEAVALVFVVMFLFLQNWRYTIIPTIVVPIALLGTFAALLALGFSINVLTMFGMVLVIGIVVDDAIVVVENVERIMSEEGLLAARSHAQGHEADLGRHHRRDRGADLGVRAAGVLRGLDRQHLPPVLGGDGDVDRLLGLHGAVAHAGAVRHAAQARGSRPPPREARLLRLVQPRFTRTAKGYESVVARILRRAARYLIIYVAIIGAVVYTYTRLPSSFLPQEDQGNIIVNVQLPPGATQERALAVMQQVEGFILKQPEVQSMVGVMGFSFSGQGQNAGLAFVTLKDWDERKDPAHSASALAGRAFGALSGIRDAFIYPLSPPPIPELGNASGFSFRLQDRSGAGHEALINARNQLLGMAGQSKILSQVRPDGLEDAPQLQIDIDRDKANALGVTFDAINSTLSTGWARATSTTSRTAAACSAWWCRPMRRPACSPTTC